ncbi:phage head closure protein [Syntrophomonas erecta]
MGDLRHRIAILEFTTYMDEWGNQISDWIETDHLWARVSNIHGREYFAAAAVQLEKMLVFTTRYREGLDESMRIRFQGRDYDIKFVDNIKYQNRYMEIKAMLTDAQ